MKLDPTGARPDLNDPSAQQYVYDAWERMVRVKDGGGATSATYKYDALARRVKKTVSQPSDLATFGSGELFYYDGNRIVEFYYHVWEDYVYCPPGGGGGAMKSRDGTTSDTGNTKPEPSIFGEDPKLQRQAVLIPPGCEERQHIVSKLRREFVWGLDYIDEQVAAYNADGALTITLQDGNYNVVGRTWDGGQLIAQYAYGPYGAFLTYPDPTDPTKMVPATEGSSGQPINIDTQSLNHANWHFFAGAWLDKETGLYHMRARYYSPTHQRFISQDPNGQALVLASALAMNARSMMAMAGLTADAQYSDGMNLYAFARSNPVTHSDPTGLVIGDGLQGDHPEPCYLGGAREQEFVRMAPEDHTARHAYIRTQGWGPEGDSAKAQRLTDEWTGKKPLSKPRGQYAKNTYMTEGKRRQVLLDSYEHAGFDSADPELVRRINKGIRTNDGVHKTTPGSYGRGTSYKKFQRKWTWQNQRGKRVRMRTRGINSHLRNKGIASGIGVAFFLWHLSDNVTSGYYLELMDLNATIAEQRGGPSLFQEVEALAIIADLNSELAGNDISQAIGWNTWWVAQDLH